MQQLASKIVFACPSVSTILIHSKVNPGSFGERARSCLGNMAALAFSGVKHPFTPWIIEKVQYGEPRKTSLRMMRETWRKLGHPSPTYENDRTRKAFELFIPGLDKEVDMASDLMKAMFGAEPPTQSSAQVEAQEAQVEAQVELAKWQLSILAACATGEQTGKQLLEAAGYKTRTGNFKKGLQRLVEQQLIEYKIPDKPNSRLQKYRLTAKGQQTLASVAATRDQARQSMTTAYHYATPIPQLVRVQDPLDQRLARPFCKSQTVTRTITATIETVGVRISRQKVSEAAKIWQIIRHYWRIIP